jgi:DNA-binding NtrC family response regulator
MLKSNSGKVLFVDDEECIRELAGAYFPDAGYDIVLADNGADALEKLSDLSFDVVVTDIMMPKLNGIDLYYRALMDNPQMKSRFIFTTGLPSLKTVSFLSQNSSPHLYKPYHMTELKKAIDSLVVSEKSSSEMRFAKRFDLVTEGRLSGRHINRYDPLVVETQNISKSGVRLRYLGGALVNGVKVELDLRAMDIKRSARVIWSSTVDDRSVSGLAFA